MSAKKTENACPHHDGLTARINGCKSRLDSIDSKNYVPSITFRWVIGILIMAIISMNSFTLKTVYEAQKMLIDVKIQQQTIIHKIEMLQYKIKEQGQWTKKRLSKY